MIYIASPYSDPDVEVRNKRTLEVTKYAGFLHGRGDIAISPIVYGHALVRVTPTLGEDIYSWERFCKALLSKCTSIDLLMLEGWKDSLGIKMELKKAKVLGMCVRFIRPEDYLIKDDRCVE